MLTKRLCILLDFLPLDDGMEDQDLEFDLLTDATFGWFDLFIGVIKHFITHVENVILASVNLTLPMVNSITPILGLIRHMIKDKTMNEKIFDFLSKKPQFLSVIHQLLDKWPGISITTLRYLWLYCDFISEKQSFLIPSHYLEMLFMGA